MSGTEVVPADTNRGTSLALKATMPSDLNRWHVMTVGASVPPRTLSQRVAAPDKRDAQPAVGTRSGPGEFVRAGALGVALHASVLPDRADTLAAGTASAVFPAPEEGEDGHQEVC